MSPREKPPRKYVSRGGEKLERGLDAFDIEVTGMRVLDVGASTGGFTDCLLQRNAAHVTAVDVGYGQLDWKLRNDARVTVIERTNFRYMADDAFPGGFDLIVIDTSFISLRTIVARARAYLPENSAILALVKPQFEAGRDRLGKKGVVRDPEVHRAVLREVRDAMIELGLAPVQLINSPLVGPAGNREFLMLLRHTGTAFTDEHIEATVAQEVG